MELSWPEYWSWYPVPSPGDLPNPGNRTQASHIAGDSLPAELPGKPLDLLAGYFILSTYISSITAVHGFSRQGLPNTTGANTCCYKFV